MASNTDGASLVMSKPEPCQTGEQSIAHDELNDRLCSDEAAPVATPPDHAPSPARWKPARKALVIVTGFLLVINSTLGSSIASDCGPYFARDFHIQSQAELVLPNSLYLLGYVLGPPVFSPLSETVGRRRVLQGAFLGFTAFTLASALAPTWASLIVFRLVTGMFASAPISVVGGMYADIFDDPLQRGRAVALLVGGTTIAPVVGPIISGFVSPVSWRWVFWIALITAGVTWPALILLPETYEPVLRARSGRKKNTLHPHQESSTTPHNRTGKDVATSTLARPLRLLVEPIVFAICAYLAFEYALFYLFFVAYPIVFQGVYNMSSGVAALPLIPIGLGAALACIISVVYDGILRKATLREVAWADSKEYRRLPLACLGGPLHVVALFWLGWTARANIHWIVPTLAGLPFGIGVELCFISLLNYLTDAYSDVAASAMATSAFTRSLFAVLLPLCVNQMYGTLGVPWSFSLLGFISLFLAAAPFLLIRYGPFLRDKSSYFDGKRRSANTDTPQELQTRRQSQK